MASRHRRLFRDLFVINFLITLGFGVSDAFFPLYCESIGARGLLLGAAVGGYALSKVLFSPVMGALADRFGRRPIVLSSLALYLAASAVYLATADLFLVVFFRFVQGLSCAMFRPVVQALVADHAPVDRRGRIMGTFDVSFYAALTAGPVLGGLIMDACGFRGLFGTLALCCLSALAVAFVSIPRDWGAPRKPVEREAAAEDAVGAGGGNRPSLPGLSPRGATFKGLLVFILGRACGITACATFLPLLLSCKLGLNGRQVGIVMASGTLVMALLLRSAGKAADRVSRQAMVVCGGTVVPVLYMLLPVAADFVQVLGVTLGIGAFSALSQPAVSALLAEEGRKLGMGATMGTFNSFLNMGFVLGPLLGALLQTTVGLQGVFIAIGSIGLLTGAGFALQSASE
jgi:MFS family permease